MSKHDAGPWFPGWEQDGEMLPDGTGSLGDYYEDGSIRCPTGEVIAENVKAHNRPLIAAAPDLLEALKNLADSFADRDGWNKLELQDLDNAQHAIDKAEGR